MRPVAKFLPDGKRLHLQHGPSDLVLYAQGNQQAAYRAAIARFETIIAEIVTELPSLRTMISPLSVRPMGAVARRMHDAARPFAKTQHVTAMAAVAGAIADEVLTAMTKATDLTRAYVNNGGDIALHLAPGAQFRTAIHGHDGRDLGRIEIASEDGIRGIATSGRHGRSLSMGIADSVTALARNAAQADVAATLIANNVNLTDHPAITRCPASDVVEDSDLCGLPVVTHCGPLSAKDCATALAAGQDIARDFQSRNLIVGAGMFLQDAAVTTSDHMISKHHEALYV